jgi:formylglycine-generating enzyme required for sulfatase activity
MHNKKTRGKTLSRCVIFACFYLLQACLFVPSAISNNLQLSNATIVSQDLTSDTAVIQFDISWDNSWRDFTNYDAVWFFIKYSDDSGQTWSHLILKTSGTNPSGFSAGTGTGVDVIVPTDKRGCFIQRSSNGSGTLDTKGIRIVWDYGVDGVADSTVKDIGLKIFAIEMVYVPQGSFYVGDNAISTASLKQGSVDSDPWYIQIEGAISVQDITTNGYYYVSGGNAGENSTGDEFIITSSFPKGYGAFYVMKYEITQGQYADFLNTITSSQASARYPDQSGNNRHTISGTHPNYMASRPGRACNYLSWMDLAAYADWAGLRPMTELEFEKAARGKDITAVDGELAWGNTSITGAAAISGSEDGTETITNAEANSCYNNQTFSGGDEGAGPLRAGIFATASSTRQRAGATYYGILEFSGSVWERCVSIGNSSGRNFLGTNGDGALSSGGNATNEDWPGYTSAQGVDGAAGSGFKGGSWLETTAGNLAVSNRSKAALTSTTRSSDYGGRCVRTAP